MTIHQLLTALILFSLSGSLARAEEYYNSRPIITTIPAKKSDVLSETLLTSSLHFVLELNIFYGNKTRFHLARDGEIFYDLDLLLWETKRAWGFEQGPRPQLINISRKSAESKDLWSYLEQQGFSEESTILNSVLIDTGYDGTIPDAVNKILVDRGLPKVNAYMVSSAHPEIASSRVATTLYQDDLGVSPWTATEADRERMLDAVGNFVDEIEELPHFTKTSVGFRKINGRWIPYSEDNEPEDRAASLAVMGEIRRAFQSQRRTQVSINSLTLGLQVMAALSGSQPLDARTAESLKAQVDKSKIKWLWADIREAVARKNLQLNLERVNELWQHIGLPQLIDLEPRQLRVVEKSENEIYAQAAPAPVGSNEPLLMERLLQYHAEHKRDRQLLAQAQRSFTDFQRDYKNTDSIEYDGRRLEVIKRLGEGSRGEVFELELNKIAKLAFEPEDMRYLAVEKQVADFLAESFERYQIRVLPVLEMGPNGVYLIKDIVPKERLAETILKASDGNLSRNQSAALERLFWNARRFAAETAVGLDIKSENLAWINGDWVLFDTGPRKSYAPYGHTLDRQNFADFLTQWNKFDPDREELSIKQVVAAIRQGKLKSLCRGEFK